MPKMTATFWNTFSAFVKYPNQLTSRARLRMRRLFGRKPTLHSAFACPHCGNRLQTRQEIAASECADHAECRIRCMIDQLP